MFPPDESEAWFSSFSPQPTSGIVYDLYIARIGIYPAETNPPLREFLGDHRGRPWARTVANYWRAFPSFSSARADVLLPGGGIASAKRKLYDHERIGAAATAPIPWLDQRLLRERLIFTSTVMYFITNLMKRIIRPSFLPRLGSPGSVPGFPSEARVLHPERA